jgi:DNA-binding NarL/FixJ family response regulator
VPSLADPPLSRREREVAQLLVGGYANLNIAAHLGISENTTRTYIRRLYKKLKVCNRIDLIRAYESTI